MFLSPLRELGRKKRITVGLRVSPKPTMASEVENDAGVTAPHTDRISSLPDTLLCHILSFLPTRTAVTTMSLVSHRWLNLWEHLQVFDFDDDYKRKKKFRKFAFFVNTVLARRRSRNIRKFNLSCSLSNVHKFPSDCVNMWIRAATGPHLEQMVVIINYGSDYGYEGEPLLLPPSVWMNCTNLVSLSLTGPIQMNAHHSSVHFPSLKWLQINFGKMKHDPDNAEFGTDLVDSLVEILSRCPKLEYLDTYFYDGFSTKVTVPPSSKRLKLTVQGFSWTCLEIDCHWLDRKDCRSIILGIIGNLQSVEEAYLDVFSLCESEFVDPLLNLLQDQNHDLHIQLRHSTSKLALHTCILNYPEFCKLHHLKFILPCCNSNLLLNVLEKCHMLQVLIVQINKEEPPSLRTWEPHSTTVAKCLESHLTYTHIEGYQGFEDELAFAEYILCNGLVLHTVLISFDTSMDITNKDRSLKRLSDIPRGSVSCQLKFDSATSPN